MHSDQGIKLVRRRLADGTERAYLYDRATGRRLPDDPAARATVVEDLRRRERLARAPESGTFEDLIRRYYAHPDFTARRPRTQTFYREHIEPLRKVYGDLPVVLMSTQWLRELRDEIVDQGHLHKARHRLVVVRLLLRFAMREIDLEIPRGLFEVRLPSIGARDQVWTMEQEERFLAAADAQGEPLMRLALLLGAYTAQRLSDILAMRREQMVRTREEGRTIWWIRLLQAKTAAPVDVPVHQRLLKALGTKGAAAELLLPSPRGLQMDRWSFHRAWDRVFDAAGLAKSGLQFRDLRRTAMVRLAEGGATPIQIAAISGHTIETTMRILEVYIPRNRLMALAGMRHLK
jgi:hypothetical protein